MTDKPQCAQPVFKDYAHYRCPSPGVLEEEGKFWCRRHAPSVVAARDAKRNAKVDQYIAESRREYRQREAEAKALPLLRAVVEAQMVGDFNAYEEAMSVAEAFLTAFDAGEELPMTPEQREQRDLRKHLKARKTPTLTQVTTALKEVPPDAALPEWALTAMRAILEGTLRNGRPDEHES